MDKVVQLAEPFPTKFVHDDGRGNAYVPHHIVVQRLIQIFGTPPKIEILRELYDDTEQGKKLTGVVMRLTLPGLEPVEEAGESDNPQSKTNGARAKDACSDAIKRCAMRLGLGLHLWSQDDYYLFEKLSNPKGGEVSGAGTDNEGQGNARLGEVRATAPAPASGKKSGSAQSEPKGAGESSSSADEDASPSAPAPSPIPPAQDLVNVHGESKVLAVARRLAKENATTQPTRWEDIRHPLAILVGQELEKQPA